MVIHSSIVRLSIYYCSSVHLSTNLYIVLRSINSSIAHPVIYSSSIHSYSYFIAIYSYQWFKIHPFILQVHVTTLYLQHSLQTQYETACNPPKQLENKVEFSQSPGNDETSQPPNSAAYGQSPGKAQPNWYASSVPLQVSGPPSYVEAAAVYPGQAPESSSTLTPYPPIGFVVPSVANH